ncbi:MAG: 16S rRNA (guanine(527)-N(7))-methyltransferase RsmG [Candidatus Saganbacteria bacterium]|nr:16S rRNA (guanine(527)-N(7))-methyltransferase RsmG [Candidatus Saganbacteria bacterium]
MTNEGILFEKYLEELIAWNKKFNLTSITDPAAIRQKHFADSLLLLDVLELNDQAVVDVGAGAGFPGLPLKIACPGIKLTLVEATKKKVAFLDHIIKSLDLHGCTAVWARAEEYARKHREEFDLAVARAVAPLNALCEYCLPLVRPGGVFAAYKQVAVEAEAAAAERALKLLGGRRREIRTFPRRSLVIIDKLASTPPGYPRPAGIAKKRPL